MNDSEEKTGEETRRSRKRSRRNRKKRKKKNNEHEEINRTTDETMVKHTQTIRRPVRETAQHNYKHHYNFNTYNLTMIQSTMEN